MIKKESKKAIDTYSPKNELEYCNIVKAILTLIIVLYHSILFFASPGWYPSKTPLHTSGILEYFANWLNSFHVYAFVLCSGYIFFYLKYEKNYYSKFVDFLFNKVKRLIVPYVFVSLMWVIPIAVILFKYTFMDIVYRFVLGIAPNQLWFLLMLFWVYICFYIFGVFFRDNTLLASMCVCILYCFSIIGGRWFPNYFMFWTAFEYIPVFFIGFKLRQFGTKVLYQVPCYFWISIECILFLLFSIVSECDATAFVLLKIAFRFLLNTFGATMVFILLEKCAPKICNNKLIDLVGRYAMPIYLFHQQIIYLNIEFLSDLISPILLIGLCFFSSITISIMLAYFLKKSNTITWLLGEKTKKR